MTIEYTATLNCDDCGEETPVDTAEYVGDTVGVEDDTIEGLGWAIVDGEHYCPECKGKHE